MFAITSWQIGGETMETMKDVNNGRKNSRVRDFCPFPKEQPVNDTSCLHQDKLWWKCLQGEEFLVPVGDLRVYSLSRAPGVSCLLCH